MNRFNFLWHLMVTTGILKDTIGKAFIQTNGQLTTNIDISQKESLLLQVRGCAKLYVVLRENEGGEEAAIGIGIKSNNGIIIKPCHTCTVKYGAESAYLDCTAFKPFWITWAGLTVKIGRGHEVGMQEILSTTSTKSYKVNFLVLEGVANWIIENEVSKCGRHLYQRIVQPLEGMINDLEVFHSFAAADIVRCLKTCHEIQGCQSINYNKQDGTCELFAALPGNGDFKAKANLQSELSLSLPLRTRARKEVTPIQQIFEDETRTLTIDEVATTPSFASIEAGLYRHRRKNLPPLPKTLADVCIEDQWAETSDGSQFFAIGDGVDNTSYASLGGLAL
ncbi:uncharacterized protein LOC124266112 [Haliotis rubra]|uniref:uncharacterized protein LOC124266112 n=1 Tax=Haliotis rubra TaxID=36100 RepID=UPI001EE514F2|nr:uncharacterized protein LOC124266112 [Haliotis rubra]